MLTPASLFEDTRVGSVEPVESPKEPKRLLPKLGWSVRNAEVCRDVTPTNSDEQGSEEWFRGHTRPFSLVPAYKNANSSKSPPLALLSLQPLPPFFQILLPSFVTVSLLSPSILNTPYILLYFHYPSVCNSVLTVITRSCQSLRLSGQKDIPVQCTTFVWAHLNPRVRSIDIMMRLCYSPFNIKHIQHAT